MYRGIRDDSEDRGAIAYKETSGSFVGDYGGEGGGDFAACELASLFLLFGDSF